MKRIVSFALTFVMLLSMGMSVFAAETDKVTVATLIAEELSQLGLLKGSDKGYELDRPITRAETMAIIIRLIGKEYEATTYTKTHPFTDVPEWAGKYVAFARDQGITAGISETKFGSDDPITARQFLTLLFRALGYSQHFDDCSYETIFTFAQDKGLIEAGEYSDQTKFLRADVVILSKRAFKQTYRFSDSTVQDILTCTRVPETGFVNTKGQGVWMAAGTFMEHPDYPFPSIDKSLSYEENRLKIAEYMWQLRGCAIFHDGIYSGDRTARVAGFIQHEDGRYGLKVFQWRKEYGWSPIVDAVLDAMYFISGDKEVAYALWSWFDHKNINGYSNTDYFGFRDLAATENGFIITMKDQEIEVIRQDKSTIVYFG